MAAAISMPLIDLMDIDNPSELPARDLDFTFSAAHGPSVQGIGASTPLKPFSFKSFPTPPKAPRSRRIARPRGRNVLVTQPAATGPGTDHWCPNSKTCKTCQWPCDSYRPPGRGSSTYNTPYEVPEDALSRHMAGLGVKRERDDRRDDDRRNGGYGGRNGGYNRKRRYQEDDDYDQRPQRRHRDDNYRVDDQAAHIKLRSMLLRIGDVPANMPEDEAKDIARLLGENYEDDARLRDGFFDDFIQLIIEQPFKIPFLGAIIFFANETHPQITTEALKRSSAKAQEALNQGEWKEFKLLLRLFACLQSILQEDGVFTILGQLFDTAVDLQSANENDVIGLELVKIILLTIPYAMVSGGDSTIEQVETLLQKTEIVAGMALPIEALVESYVGDEDKPFPHKSIIRLLQEQLQAEGAKEPKWEFACIPRFSRAVARQLDGDDTLPAAPTMHACPTITIPSPVNPGLKPLFPEAYFSLYADQDIESVPKSSDVAASLLRDALVDTLDQLDFNRGACAQFLVNVDQYWHPDTFALRGTALDKLGSREGDKSTWKSEDMIIDAVFSQIFKLPNPQHKLVYYHSIIFDCCKIAPSAVAPALGRAIRFIFKNLDRMDLELANRFLDWFSHHLSNFEFRWRWVEWTADLELSNLHPKKAFITAALDKEIRLSFAKRIRSTLPEAYHSLITEGMEKDRPDFKYENEQLPFATEGRTLLHQVRKRAPDESIQETIDTIHTKATELGLADVLIPSTDALVTALCFVGSKSLSHVLTCIERNKDRLLAIAQSSEAARRQIITSVCEYWRFQPGVAVNIIDKLLNYTIIAPITIVQWAMSDHLDAGEGLTQAWVYEMVSNTVTKVTQRVRQIVQMRFQPGLPDGQIPYVEENLAADRQAMRELFSVIEDSVRAVAEGSADKLMEKEQNGDIEADDAALLKAWGKRWHTVFVRKAQVEESVVGEEAVEARIKLLAAAPAEAAAAEVDEEGNGVTADGNDDAEMAQA